MKIHPGVLVGLGVVGLAMLSAPPPRHSAAPRAPSGPADPWALTPSQIEELQRALNEIEEALAIPWPAAGPDAHLAIFDQAQEDLGCSKLGQLDVDGIIGPCTQGAIDAVAQIMDAAQRNAIIDYALDAPHDVMRFAADLRTADVRLPVQKMLEQALMRVG